MRNVILCLTAASMLACDSNSTEPTHLTTPTAVPAGISDPAWASLNRVCTVESPVYPVPQSQRSAMAELTHPPGRSSDDDWSDVAQTVPGGWGGLFVETGTPIIFLTDTAKRDEAIAALKSSKLAPFQLDLNSAVARAGRWNFLQLAEWYRLVIPVAEKVFGWRMADIDEVRNRIELTVISTAARGELETKLQTLNIPCYLVAIKVQ